ncbi:hypothetical protein RB596_005910 [Gaeumannomyces avenae]
MSSSRRNKPPKASKSSRTPNPEEKQWTDWAWVEEYGCSYRCAYNEHGEVIATEYDSPYYTPDNVPRKSGDPVDGLTDSLGETSLVDQSNPVDPDEHYTLGQSKGKSIAISPEAQDAPGQTTDEPYTDGSTTEPTQDGEDPFYDSRGLSTEGGEHVEGVSVATDRSYDTHGAYPQAGSGATDDDYDPQMAAVIHDSRKDLSRRAKPGQSSTSQNLGHTYEYASQSPSYAAPDSYSTYQGETQAYAEPGSAYAAEGDDPDEAYVGEAANTVPEMPKTITGTLGDYESMDPRFRLMNSQHWQPGTVFKILWAEPQGQSKAKNAGTFYTERHTVDNGAGKLFHTKLRRFIIYGTGEGQSTCVPIFTYNNQGCKKNGVKPENHGIVHDYNHAPKMLPGEPLLGFDPAAIVLTEGTEKISRDSRVNYSQLMTVQHNVKIFIIGYTDQDSFQVVRAAVDDCWNRLSTSFGGAPKKSKRPPRR